MFFSFDEGDFLIHHKYGIGKFINVEKISINNTCLDFFRFQYLNDSFLLVPAYNIGVFKFHSHKGSPTQIDTLGRSLVFKKKKKVQDEIAKMAQDLMEIYKKRESLQAPVFSINPMYLSFCDKFPYELTASQLKVLNEILHDLAISKPMDRLLCGDVGFGKTEVASRAIALALFNGYKALFIVPTTILASQHFDLLKERFEGLGKKVALLCKLQQDTFFVKKAWKAGEIDLLITTAHHRGIENLLIEQIGLIMLDEEHHFGVKFKEKIKLKAHSLQLSATPIPRTLHLALSKIKDISIIEYPPAGRKENQVFVCSLSEIDLEKIITTEVNSGGKVFLVVPRVSLINEIADLLSFVEFSILHGQMSSSLTQTALNDFLNGRTSVLLSTNIIESGLNVLSANLMIVFYAQMFGVAQLHQLKGRVGRASSQGRVFYILPSSLKEVSTDRIKMIEQNSALGGGFSLAMQDMESRGSGTVIGHKQSGKDYGFGVEMYFDMLSECLGTSRVAKKESKIAWVGFSSAFIPSDYIVDDKIRFSFYKQLSMVSRLSDLKRIVDDLRSFGSLPDVLLAFLDIVKINLISQYLAIKKVVKGAENIEIFYYDISLEIFVSLNKIVNLDYVNKRLTISHDKIDRVIKTFEDVCLSSMG